MFSDSMPVRRAQAPPIRASDGSALAHTAAGGGPRRRLPAGLRRGEQKHVWVVLLQMHMGWSEFKYAPC